MFKKTVKGELKFPPHVSEECQDLVSKLLKLDATQRLGMQRHGAQDVKEHAWYSGFDWRSFEAQAMQAPYVPVVRCLYMLLADAAVLAMTYQCVCDKLHLAGVLRECLQLCSVKAAATSGCNEFWLTLKHHNG